jgi:hypothetical protein
MRLACEAEYALDTLKLEGVCLLTVTRISSIQGATGSFSKHATALARYPNAGADRAMVLNRHRLRADRGVARLVSET